MFSLFFEGDWRETILNRGVGISLVGDEASPVSESSRILPFSADVCAGVTNEASPLAGDGAGKYIYRSQKKQYAMYSPAAYSADFADLNH